MKNLNKKQPSVGELLNLFIESLYELTKDQNINWFRLRSYLDREYNSPLESFISQDEVYNYKNYGMTSVDIDNSYMTEVAGSYIYILNKDKNYYIYTQNDIASNIEKIEIPKEQMYLFEKLVDLIIDLLNVPSITMNKIIKLSNEYYGNE